MRFSDLADLFRTLFFHRRVEPRKGSLPGPRQEFAVIGLGRFGSSLAQTLVERGHTVLGIDRDPALVQAWSDKITQTLALDTTDENVLREIDIAGYETVIVAVGTNFEANLMTTVALKAVGVRTVICKAATERQQGILRSVGADRVVLPEHESGSRIAQELSTPGILNDIPLVGSKRVSELRVPRSMIGHTLREVEMEKRFGLCVAAAVRGEQVVIAPKEDFILGPEDLLVVIGESDDIIKILSL